jgi:fructose-specific component phosphotransferase system IIB-like protein
MHKRFWAAAVRKRALELPDACQEAETDTILSLVVSIKSTLVKKRTHTIKIESKIMHVDTLETAPGKFLLSIVFSYRVPASCNGSQRNSTSTYKLKREQCKFPCIRELLVVDGLL